MTIDDTWSINAPFLPPPIVAFFLDGRLLDAIPVSLEENNGVGKQYHFRIENFDSINGESMFLEFFIENSRNLKQLGLSDDDRNLGIMIRSIRIDCDRDPI